MKKQRECQGPVYPEELFEGDYEAPGHSFHSLMPFKVRKVLLVASLYDAFIIEEEGLIPELVVGEYANLRLGSPPHVERVSSGARALQVLGLKDQKWDLVITMSKNIGMDPVDFGREVKDIKCDIPVVLLATDTADLHRVREQGHRDAIDKLFFWNGDSKLFLAIIKYIEDRENVQHDTSSANVRVLIMVEDSVRYYSMFLPLIYLEIMNQAGKLISEELNETQRRLRRRVRPKILLAESFEEGMAFYNDYRDNVLGIVSDVNYPYKGKSDPEAGCEFIRQIKEHNPHMPTLLQSSSLENHEKAEQLGAYFLHKHSPNLLLDFRHFLLSHLGFGDFIFLIPKEEHSGELSDPAGVYMVQGPGKESGVAPSPNMQKVRDWLHDETVEIGRASDLRDFEEMLGRVTPRSILFHGARNNFSNWLMARGEFQLAERIQPMKVSDFSSPDEIRGFLIRLFRERRKEKQKGVISDFAQQEFEFGSSFSRLGEGSLGGKGRGLAFMRTILARSGIEKRYPNIHITMPSTVVIGTEKFDEFIQANNLHAFRKQGEFQDSEVAAAFLEGKVPGNLREELRRLLRHFKRPLAVRSSSLLEDSQNHPFAGIYATYMLPNNHPDEDVRLEQLCQAIRLVYASVFYRDARAYIEATAASIEEEKMAVIVQELVGKPHWESFYPDFSGVAQSYNFYPISWQKFEDGIVSVAIGLGKTVVGGSKVLRFSPKHPGIIPEFSTVGLIMENSQKELFALDTTKTEFTLTEDEDAGTLKKLALSDIEKDGTLEHLVSTYDREDGVLRDSIYHDGPRFATFAGVLKYDVFPLSKLLNEVLLLGEGGMGSPVEIEFAVNLAREKGEKPLFAILQIRPLVTDHEHCEIGWDKEIPQEGVLLHSDKALGNGAIYDIQDIIYVPPGRFDSAKTVQIAAQVGKMNKKLAAEGSPYLLMGPGRWGTQDPWLGVPVDWSQISGVRVMVETALEDFNIEPSQGTHFFQNITSRHIGYITIPPRAGDSFVDWDWLEGLEAVSETTYLRHVRLEEPLTVKLDGRCGGALVLKPGVEKKEEEIDSE